MPPNTYGNFNNLYLILIFNNFTIKFSMRNMKSNKKLTELRYKYQHLYTYIHKP